MRRSVCCARGIDEFRVRLLDERPIDRRAGRGVETLGDQRVDHACLILDRHAGRRENATESPIVRWSNRVAGICREAFMLASRLDLRRARSAALYRSVPG